MSTVDDFYQVQEIDHLPDARKVNPPAETLMSQPGNIATEIDWQRVAGVSFFLNKERQPWRTI